MNERDLANFHACDSAPVTTMYDSYSESQPADAETNASRHKASNLRWRAYSGGGGTLCIYKCPFLCFCTQRVFMTTSSRL